MRSKSRVTIHVRVPRRSHTNTNLLQRVKAHCLLQHCILFHLLYGHHIRLIVNHCVNFTFIIWCTGPLIPVRLSSWILAFLSTFRSSSYAARARSHAREALTEYLFLSMDQGDTCSIIEWAILKLINTKSMGYNCHPTHIHSYQFITSLADIIDRAFNYTAFSALFR